MMKLILLMYLQDDEEAVDRFLANHGVIAYSRLEMEGRTAGRPSVWTGEVAPYRSRMVFTLLPEPRATELLEAVRACDECQDPRHPIHAVQLEVERSVSSGGATEADPTSTA